MIDFDTEKVAGDVGVLDRSLGDYVSPYRSGSVVSVVNRASRVLGGDVSGWGWRRVVLLVASVERERRE